MTDQCHGSLGRLWRPWAGAWPASQRKHGLACVIGLPSAHEKSTASLPWWFEVPGRAVGGEHDEGGAR